MENMVFVLRKIIESICNLSVVLAVYYIFDFALFKKFEFFNANTIGILIVWANAIIVGNFLYMLFYKIFKNITAKPKT